MSENKAIVSLPTEVNLLYAEGKKSRITCKDATLPQNARHECRARAVGDALHSLSSAPMGQGGIADLDWFQNIKERRGKALGDISRINDCNYKRKHALQIVGHLVAQTKRH